MAEKSKNALVVMAESKRDGLWNLRASYLPNINQEVYFKRALLTVLENKDLAALSKTETGALSILKAIGKALQMGLQIGGSIPQAYIVAFKENAVLIPTAEGFRFITTSEPDPVLKSFDVRPVYDGEDFSLDFGSGAVRHIYDGRTKRGKLIGVYCQIEELSGTRRVQYMTRDEIEKIRDTHSRYFINFKKGPWLEDYDAMCLKTAAKKFLKPYAAMKEGLAMALAVDDGESIRDSRPMRDRVGDRLDGIIDAEYVDTSDPDQPKKPAEKAEPEPAGSPGGKKPIF